MAEPTFSVLDVEAVQNPEVLLDLLSDMMNTQAVMLRAMAIIGVLLLNDLGELGQPSEADYRVTVRLLREFLDGVAQHAKNQAQADLLRDLLEAKE